MPAPSLSLLNSRLDARNCRVDRILLLALPVQWTLCLALAIWVSPLFWPPPAPPYSGIILSLTGLMAGGTWLGRRFFLSARRLRFALAVNHLVLASTMIHLAGGRPEAHAPILVTLWLLSLFHDRSLLYLGAGLALLDHGIRAFVAPFSILGSHDLSPSLLTIHLAALLGWSVLLAWRRGEETGLLELEALRERDLRDAKEAAESGFHDRLAELHASQEQYRCLSEASPVGIFHSSAEGQFLYTNLHWQEMFGLTNQAGEGWSGVLHPDDREIVMAAWAETVRAQAEFSVETRIRPPEGRMKWVHLRSSPIRTSEGLIQGHVGTAEDISERKERDRLNALERSAAQAMSSVVDVDTAVERFLGEACRIYDWTVGTFWRSTEGSPELTCEKFWQLPGEDMDRFRQVCQTIRFPVDEGLPGWSAPDDRPAWISNLAQEPQFTRGFVATECGLRSGCVFPVPLGGGRTGAMEFFGRRVEPPDHLTIQALEGLCRQFGQFVIGKMAEVALRTSEARTRSIVDTMIDGIITFDSAGIVEWVNPAVTTIFQHHSTALMGMSIGDLIPELDQRPERAEKVEDLDLSQRCILEVRWEATGVREDGSSFPVELGISELRQTGDRVLTVIVRDITERREVDQLKNEFISTVSHELRTPLTSIRGSLGLLDGGVTGELPAPAKQMVDIALSNCERLIRLINDILDIEKIAMGRMVFELRPLELISLVRQQLQSNQSYAEQLGVSFVLEEIVPDAWVRADGDRVAQVFTNLLSNAAKFSPKGSTVSIQVLGAERNRVRVSVTDQGPGIPEKFRSRIFNRFAQADSSDSKAKGGTGLGLSISKTMIERMAGTIGFDTEMGKGSTFWFELPATLPVKPVHREEGSWVAAEREVQTRILVCEDDADISTMLQMLFESDGFVVDVAPSGRAARELLRSGPYDVMTLDLRLPDEDGIALLRDIRDEEDTREMPVIVVSARARSDEKSLIEGEALVLSDWLDKPIDPQRLLAAVRRSAGWEKSGKPRVLHVEDEPSVSAMVQLLLQDECEVVAVATMEEALVRMDLEQYDLLILDVALPDGNGLDLVPEVKRLTGKHIPVLVFSGRELDSRLAQTVSASLVKTETSNDELKNLVRRLTRQSRSVPDLTS